MHVPDSFLDAVHTDGFAVMEGFLDAEELAAARAAVFEVYPHPTDYFSNPESYRHLVEHQFAGLRRGPYEAQVLNRLAIHPDLVGAAERFCGTTDIECYKIELWGKYGGAVDYDQAHHRDFGNHTVVVPHRDGTSPQLTSFVLLSDVTEHNGPTKVLPRSIGDAEPMVPLSLETGSFADEEIAVTGPAGSLFSYTTDVFHRGSSMRGDEQSRFVLLTDFAERGHPWRGKMSWPSVANQPAWTDMVTDMTVRERDLFGFPPPGSDYWTAQTLHDVGLRYPGMDMDPYR